METYQKLVKTISFALLGFTLISQSCIAEDIWHCSRSDVQIADASDDFTLASLVIDREVIRISLRDLYNVYQGSPVHLSGGLPLSACVFAAEKSSPQSALESIGLSIARIKAVANLASSPINHIHVVSNESEMQACISNHHPAIGYLPLSTSTEAIGPCF